MPEKIFCLKKYAKKSKNNFLKKMQKNITTKKYFKILIANYMVIWYRYEMVHDKTWPVFLHYKCDISKFYAKIQNVKIKATVKMSTT